MIHVLPHLALFPYTTLFRSDALFATGDEDQGGHARGDHQQHRDLPEGVPDTGVDQDRKSTRLNSSHVAISYAVFCLKKKTQKITAEVTRTQHREHKKVDN